MRTVPSFLSELKHAAEAGGDYEPEYKAILVAAQYLHNAADRARPIYPSKAEEILLTMIRIMEGVR